MSEERSPLSILLAGVYETCPTRRRFMQPGFVALWQDQIDVALTVSEDRLLDALILNRDVARFAGGPEGDSYARRALANAARILCRMGEDVGEAAASAWEDESPSERICLTEYRSILRYEEKDLLRDEAGWPDGPTRKTWESLCERNRLSLESAVRQNERLKSGHASPASKESRVSPAGSYRFDGPERPDVDVSAESRLYQFLNRLTLQRLSSQYLAQGKAYLAAVAAEKAGIDGERLFFQALIALGEIHAKSEDPRRVRIRYRAYRARRLAERLSRMQMNYFARRWSREAAEWAYLAKSSDLAQESSRERFQV